jgi:hypothetical protein
MAKAKRKAKSAEEIAALTGGDADDIKEAFASVRIIRGDETESHE